MSKSQEEIDREILVDFVINNLNGRRIITNDSHEIYAFGKECKMEYHERGNSCEYVGIVISYQEYNKYNFAFKYNSHYTHETFSCKTYQEAIRFLNERFSMQKLVNPLS